MNNFKQIMNTFINFIDNNFKVIALVLLFLIIVSFIYVVYGILLKLYYEQKGYTCKKEKLHYIVMGIHASAWLSLLLLFIFKYFVM